MLNVTHYLWWVVILFAQNWSFTVTSRARNSNSLARHARASILSNGVWIFSQMLMLGPMFDALTGKLGVGQQVLAGAVYTAATMIGSISAHYYAKKTEKGKSAVGASDRYKQITHEEWDKMGRLFAGITESLLTLTAALSCAGMLDKKGDVN